MNHQHCIHSTRPGKKCKLENQLGCLILLLPFTPKPPERHNNNNVNVQQKILQFEKNKIRKGESTLNMFMHKLIINEYANVPVA
jgi:hypothetical protein